MIDIDFIDKLLICVSAMTVGLIMDVISLIYDWMNLFELGTLIMAVSIIAIGISLYVEIGKYQKETSQ